MSVAVGRDQLFDALRDACIRCGRLSSADCARCGPRAQDDAPADERIGARAQRAADGRAGTVVEVAGKVLTLVLDDGQVAYGAGHELRIHATLPESTGRSTGERLLAAPHCWSLAEAAAAPLRSRAQDAAASASGSAQLRFAELAQTLDRPALVEALKPGDDARRWLEALNLARTDGMTAAARCLLPIDGTAFPGRLAVWTSAVDAMDDALLEQVHDAAGRFADEDDVVGMAARILRTATGARRGRGDDDAARLRTALGRLDGQPWRVHLERAHAADTAVAQLLRQVEDDPAGLRHRPDLIGVAPTALLDDLVDDGTIDAEWLDMTLPAPIVDHLAARTDPGRMSDAAVERLGLVRERAVRQVRRGRPLPDDIPDDVAASLSTLQEIGRAAEPGDAALRALDADDDPAADGLRAALADPTAVPQDTVLGSAVARYALGRAAVEALDLDGVERRDLSPAQQRFAGSIALERARRALYGWQHATAATHARTALRVCGEEAVRDEALNVLACVAWLDGDDTVAISALESALEGRYTFVLQANIGVVAQHLQPDIAATHLTRLIDEAPSLAMRVEAAKRALLLWRTTGTADEPDDELPTALAHALRAIVCQSIAPEDFRRLVRILALHDATWMADEASLAGSPHAASPGAELFRARANGIMPFVEVLARLLRADGPAEWLRAERDQLVAGVLAWMSGQETSPAAASLGNAMIDADLPMDSGDRIVLRSTTAAEVAWVILEDADGASEPATRFLDWLEEDRAAVPSLPQAERDRAAAAVAYGYDTVARAHLRVRWPQLKEAAALLARAEQIVATTTRFQRHSGRLRDALADVERYAADTAALMERLQAGVDGELSQSLDEVLKTSRRFVDGARTLRRKA